MERYMDYDNKIENRELSRNQRHKDVLLFLNEELNNLQDTTATQTYNLEREYAKTKKNKSPFVILLLFVCFAVTLGMAWIVSNVIEKQNQNIEINLSEFDALNLKDLLDSVTKIQDKYDNAVKQQSIYKSQMETELKEAERKHDDDLFLVESLSEIDAESVQGRRRQINNEYYSKIEEIKAEYEPKIAALEQEIAEYKQELETYDASKIDAAREKDRAVDGERQIQELERKRLVEMYEKQISDLQRQLHTSSENKSYRKAVNQVSGKYKNEMDKLDPIFEDEKADEIVNENKFAIVKTFNAERLFTYYQLNEEKDGKLMEGFNNYQAYYDKYKYLRDAVASVPQKNSVRDYVAVTNKLVDRMSETFEETTINLKEERDEYQRQLLNLQKSIEELKASHEDELNRRSLEYQKSNIAYTECINEMLNHTEHNAVVVQAPSKNNVSVYVVPRARYLITAAGADVEIYGLNVVRGRLIPQERGYYRFLPAVDADGKEVDYNLKDIVPGSIVKILAK